MSSTGTFGSICHDPGILDRHRDRLAAPVSLIRQHDLILPPDVRRHEQRRRARLDLVHGVDGGHLRHVVPLARGGVFRLGELRHREGRARARRPHRELREVRRLPCAVDHHRQHVADRRAAPAAFGKRSPASQHQQAAAALVREVGQHAELLGRERRRFDAAQDDRAIGEQLFARLREPADQFVRRRDVAPPVLVLGGALQDDDLHVLVVLDRAADELHLEPRLAFEVQDLFLPVAHLDERVARVVLGDLLAFLRRNLEAEEPRARRPRP